MPLRVGTAVPALCTASVANKAARGKRQRIRLTRTRTVKQNLIIKLHRDMFACGGHADDSSRFAVRIEIEGYAVADFGVFEHFADSVFVEHNQSIAPSMALSRNV